MQESIDSSNETSTQAAPPERGRAWRIVAIVLTLHAALLGSVVLIQGCSKSDTVVKNDVPSAATTPAPDSTTPQPDTLAQSQGTTVLPGSDALTPEEHTAPLTPTMPESVDPSLAASPAPTTPSIAPISPQPEIRPEMAPVTPTPEPSQPAIASTEKKASPVTKYVVKKGDTLGKIAKRNKVSLTELAAANKMEKNAALKIGQKLILPGKTTTVASAAPSAPASATASTGSKTHLVKSGESPTSIAKLYGISVQTLMKANRITDPRKMRVNQKLVIPVARVADLAPAPAPMPAPQPNADLKPAASEEPTVTVAEANKI